MHSVDEAWPEGKRTEKYIDSENTLHRLKKRRNIGSKSLESPSTEGKKEANASLTEIWKHVTPGH
eukprot:1148120-Pelagomonas_calceolata.AAC.2